MLESQEIISLLSFLPSFSRICPLCTFLPSVSFLLTTSLSSLLTLLPFHPFLSPLTQMQTVSTLELFLLALKEKFLTVLDSSEDSNSLWNHIETWDISTWSLTDKQDSRLQKEITIQSKARVSSPPLELWFRRDSKISVYKPVETVECESVGAVYVCSLLHIHEPLNLWKN